MADPQQPDSSVPKSEKDKCDERRDAKVGADPASDIAAEASAANAPADPNNLTADEQMALYEQDLKENDWGHQPC